QWSPDMCKRRKCHLRGCHADDDMWTSVQNDRLANHTGIRPEPSLPKRIADYDDAVLALFALGWHKRATELRSHPNDIEKVAADERGIDALRLIVAGVVPSLHCPCRRSLDRRHSRDHVEKIAG